MIFKGQFFNVISCGNYFKKGKRREAWLLAFQEYHNFPKLLLKNGL